MVWFEDLGVGGWVRAKRIPAVKTRWDFRGSDGRRSRDLTIFSECEAEIALYLWRRFASDQVFSRMLAVARSWFSGRKWPGYGPYLSRMMWRELTDNHVMSRDMSECCGEFQHPASLTFLLMGSLRSGESNDHGDRNLEQIGGCAGS